MIELSMDANDLNQIKAILKAEIDGSIQNLEQKMFDWKSEIIDSVDGLAKEVKDNREFREVSSHQTSSKNWRKKVFGIVEA